MTRIIRKMWPLLLVSALFLFPKLTFAADWVNIGFADNNIKTAYVDPKNNQHIMVSLVSQIQGYNYTTNDGGNTWEPVNFGGVLTVCNEFTVGSNTQNEFWAACSGGLFHSTDSGKSFSKVTTQLFNNLTMVKVLNNGSIIIGAPGGTFSLSLDGIIWEYKNVPGGPNPRLFQSPFEQNVLYLYNNYYGSVTFAKSSDAGKTWSVLSTKQDLNNVNNLYFLNENKMCATRNGMIGCSEDGGVTWGVFGYIQNITGYDSIVGIQNPDEPSNVVIQFLRYSDGASALYATEDGMATWKEAGALTKASSLSISQGVTFGWSQSTNLLKGLWRNDGIAVVPEYLKRHPVIIVPGILGSWEKFGSLQLDPILHTYTDLVDSLKNNGFEINKNLFLFPYNWRQDNEISAELLENLIGDIKQKTNSQKVDIVAHSMGGLVVRAYAESDLYHGDIDQIIFLGTPQLGSPEAYPVVEAGDLSFNKPSIVGTILKYVFTKEAKNSGFTGENAIFEYINNNVPSVSQLLPITNYLGWYGNVENFVYPTLYPRNKFLENLNNKSWLLKVRGIKTVNIVNNDVTTPRNFKLVTNNNLDKIWPNGIPFGYPYGVGGVIYGLGDKTVPIESASAIADKNIVLSGIEHGDLPKKAIEQVFKELGVQLVNKPSLTDTFKKNLFISAYSPVDFYVLAPDGKKIGFNKDGADFNEIDSAFYTGNGSETEFLTIPNPLPGEYKVVTIGTGVGSYKIEATYADEDKNITISSSYTGNATIGRENKLIVNLEPETEEISTNIDDRMAPATTATITGNKNNEYYISDVQITLSASDSESGVAKTEYSFDGLTWQKYDSLINLENDGTSTIYYRSSDYADNIEVTQSLNIRIDKTSPTVDIWLAGDSRFTRWDKPRLECSASDVVSGLEKFTVNLDGKELVCGSVINLFEFKPCSYLINYYARDNAGNFTAGSVRINVIVTYESLLRDMLWLYSENSFKSLGDLISVVSHVETAHIFDLFSLHKKASSSLLQAKDLLTKQKEKKKITKPAYDMIIMDINYLLEGK